MTKVISCINLKGGVGKTALAVALADFMGRQGRHTLLIDLDPQTNATFSYISPKAWQKHTTKYGSVANLLGARAHTKADGTERKAIDVILSDVRNNVDLLPSHLDLFTVDLDLGGTTARETKLRRALQGTFLADYEYVVCDCPPNLTIPTQNAISLSTHYVVPISPDFLSAIGVALLKRRVERFCMELEHNLNFLGIVISRVGRTSTFRTEMIASLREQFGDIVLEPILKERTKVAESAQSRTSVFDMGDRSAEIEFTNVCQELVDRIEQTE